VVGDADQSIYAFRARRSATSRVRARLPDARTILLEQNYRSTQTILNAANAVIARNTGRKPKNLWTDAGDGEPITATSPTTSTTRRLGSRSRSTRSVDAGDIQPQDDRRLLPDQRQSRVFEESSSASAALPVVGAVRFYERARSATRWPTCASSPTRRRREPAPDRQHAATRASASGPRPCVAAFAEREQFPFAGALEVADQAPGITPVR
jgi:DNA helicase-2/ATP-dependent DNA helicase PcrA